MVCMSGFISLKFQETATEELLCSPVHSEAEGGDGPHYSGGSSEREDETHTYTQVTKDNWLMCIYIYME